MAIKERNPLLAELFRTPQSRTYTVAGATLLLTVLMIFFVIRPSVSRILTQISENAERREILGQMNTKFSNLESLINKENTYSDQINTLDIEIIPDSRREDEFVANIAKGADTNGVSLLNIGVQPFQTTSVIEENPNIEKYVLTGSIRGERNEIEKFLEFLEAFPRTINIYDLVLSRIASEQANQDGGENSFRADFKAVVYLWKGTVDGTTPTPQPN
jgi:hypothetical protein